MLTWNQRHRRGRLIQDELKIYRRSYHPPNLNVPETLYSLFVSFPDARAFQLNARALAYNLILEVHWVQSPRSVAKFLHVVMMTLSNLGYSLVQDNRSLEEAELEGELVL